MNGTASVALAAVLLAANPPAPTGDTPPVPRTPTAIVGGKHIQPRATTPDGAPGGADVSPADADEVERLYQQLMRETAPEGGAGKPPTPSR